jgi:hypothetical protein
MSRAEDLHVSVERSAASLGAASSLAAVAFGVAYLLGECLSNGINQGIFSGVSFVFFEVFTFIISVSAFLSGLAFLANLIVFVWPDDNAVWVPYSQKLLKTATYVTFFWGGFWGFTIVVFSGALRLLNLFYPPAERGESLLRQIIVMAIMLAAFSLTMFMLKAFPVYDAVMHFEITEEFGVFRGVGILGISCIGAAIFVLSCYKLDVSVSPSVVGPQAGIIEIRFHYTGVGSDSVVPKVDIRPVNDYLKTPSISSPALVELEQGSYIGWLNAQGLASGAYIAEFSPGPSEPWSWKNWPKWCGRFLVRRFNGKRLAFFVEAKQQ